MHPRKNALPTLAIEPFLFENTIDVVVVQSAVQLVMRAKHSVAVEFEPFEQAHRGDIERGRLAIKLVLAAGCAGRGDVLSFIWIQILRQFTKMRPAS